MKQIKTLAELSAAARNRRSVVVPSWPCWSKPRPAGFLLNIQGGQLFRLFGDGMFIYEKKAKKRWGGDLIPLRPMEGAKDA